MKLGASSIFIAHLLIILLIAPAVFCTTAGLIDPEPLGLADVGILLPLAAVLMAILINLFAFLITIPLMCMLCVIHILVWNHVLNLKENHGVMVVGYCVYWVVIGIAVGGFVSAFGSLDLGAITIISAGITSGLASAGTVLLVHANMRMRQKKAEKAMVKSDPLPAEANQQR